MVKNIGEKRRNIMRCDRKTEEEYKRFEKEVWTVVNKEKKKKKGKSGY